jgi:4-amino-4-deoxy-L-arabinose transferase-like glycosyltransferase
VAALAVISAFSLLSLPRAVVNLIDWFAVALFTSLGIFIWVYWIALNFGVPQNLAQRASSLAPGVQGNANVYEVMMGLFATLAWIALITWRIRKGNPRLWRPVVLSAGGLTLLWVLLMTLWRPAIDRIQGQYTLARSLESGWVRAASARLSLTSGGVRAVIARQRQQFRQRVGDPSACVQLSQESPALDAIAVALTNLPVADQSTCAWRLALFNPNSKTSERWKIIWQSSATEDRRSRERFVLLERNP